MSFPWIFILPMLQFVSRITVGQLVVKHGGSVVQKFVHGNQRSIHKEAYKIIGTSTPQSFSFLCWFMWLGFSCWGF